MGPVGCSGGGGGGGVLGVTPWGKFLHLTLQSPTLKILTSLIFPAFFYIKSKAMFP